MGHWPGLQQLSHGSACLSHALLQQCCCPPPFGPGASRSSAAFRLCEDVFFGTLHLVGEILQSLRTQLWTQFRTKPSGFLSDFSGAEQGRTPGWWSGSSCAFSPLSGVRGLLVWFTRFRVSLTELPEGRDYQPSVTAVSSVPAMVSARGDFSERPVQGQRSPSPGLCSQWNIKLRLMSLLPLHPHPLGLTWWHCACEMAHQDPHVSGLQTVNF